MIRKVKNIFHLLTAIFSVIYFRYPARKMTVIGVTGTDGKTTTCHLIYHLLKSAGYSVGLISTVGAYYGSKEIDTGFHTTTPNSFHLQKLIHQMQQAGVKYLVLEVTSHALDQYRVFGCNFKVGVLTNITHDHLDYFCTMDNLILAKTKLLTSAKVAIVNKLDPSFTKVKSIISKTKNNPSTVIYPNDSIDTPIKDAIEKRFTEPYNQLNAEAAILAVQSIGIPVIKIPQAITTFPGVPGRMEYIVAGQYFTVIVDFASTPNALENVLSGLRKNLKENTKLICVFGCAGERDKGKRPMMGKISTKLADLSIFTAEDPRTENVDDIINQIAGGEVGNKYLIEPDRKKAIELAISKAKRGDIIIVCGKGHEKSMCFGKKEIPWSDQEVILASIRNLRKPRSAGSADK